MAHARSVHRRAWADDVPLYHDKGFWAQQFQAVGDAAKEKTGVRIVQTSYAPPEQYKAFIQVLDRIALTARISSPGGPADLQGIIATGKIAPLDDVWEQMVSSGQYEKATQDLFKVDGKTYAVPLSVSRWVALYNKKMFADNGLAEPKTWDDLMEAAEKLKSAGMTPFEATVQEGWRGFIWFEELMIRTDPKAYKGLHDGSVPYDGPAVQKVFQLWSDMYAKGYLSDPRSNEEAQDFARGKAAMYLIGEWAEGIVENAGLKADSGFGAFIMPNVDPKLPSSVIVEAGPIVVSTAGKQKKDVMTALNFWTSVDGANVWAKASGNYEGNNKANPPNPTVAKISADIKANNTVCWSAGGKPCRLTCRANWWPSSTASWSIRPWPTPKRSWDACNRLNADYWASKR